MSGFVTVRWVANGVVVKDELVPYSLAGVETIGDHVSVTSPLGDEIKLEVTFAFDPVLVPRERP